MRCTRTIAAPSGYRLRLNLESFSTEANYDEVMIYDAPTTEGAPVATLSGSVSSRAYVSTGSAMTLRFTSDQSQTRSGFVFSWRATATASLASSCQPRDCQVPTVLANGQCSFEPLLNDTTCSDGSAGTFFDRCQGGQCVGQRPAELGDATSFTVSNVPAGGQVLVRVAVRSLNGTGPFSPVVAARAAEGAPSRPPGDVRASPASATSLLITWDAIPARNRGGVLTQMNLSLTEEEDIFGAATAPLQQTFVAAGPQATRQTVAGLLPYTRYSVAVAGETAAGQGPFSAPVVVRTGPALPLAALALPRADAVMARAVALSFDPIPKSAQRGPIAGYRITHQDTTVTGDPVATVVNATTANITGLLPYRAYVFTVAVVNPAGVGPASPALRVVTAQASPEDPPLLAVSRTDARAVEVSLGVGADDRINGALVSYALAAKRRPYSVAKGCDASATCAIQQPLNSSTCSSLPRNHNAFCGGDESRRCIAGSCVAEQPAVDLCQQQSPIFDATYGVVEELSYANRVTCPLTLRGPVGHVVELSLLSFNTEATYDVLRITNTDGGTLAQLSGIQSPGATYVSTGRDISLRFTSDASQTRSGFRFSYRAKLAAGGCDAASCQLGADELGLCLAATCEDGKCTRRTLQNGAPCDDGNDATLLDMCTAGVCAGVVPLTLAAAGNITHRVENLLPYSEYLLTAAAVTVAGRGPFSEAVVGTTAEALPLAAPVLRSAAAVPGAPDALLVQWQGLSIADSGGPILRYRLFFTSVVDMFSAANVTVSGEAVLNGTGTSLQLEGLLPYTAYDIRVRAENRVGHGPSSSSVTSRTTLGVPAGVPSVPRVLTAGRSSVTLEYTAPPPRTWRGPRASYIVFYAPRAGGTVGAVSGTLQSNATSLTVDGLSPYTEYTFQVALINAAGTGPRSEASAAVRTLEVAALSSPSNLTAAASSATALALAWMAPPPQTLGGQLRGFALFAIPRALVGAGSLDSVNLTADGVARVDIDAPGARSGVIPGLQVYGAYFLGIAARTTPGTGPLHFAPSAVFTGQGTPGVPTDVDAFATSPTALQVSWERPAAANGVPSYRVKVVLADSDRPEDDARVVDAGQVAQLTVSALLRNRVYNVSVQAYTVAGQGQSAPGGDEPGQSAFSAPVQAATEQDRPSGPPEGLRVETVGTVAAALAWTVPAEPNGDIVGYRLRVWQVGDVGGGPPASPVVDLPGEPPLLTLETGDRNTTIGGLAPFTAYVVFIAAGTRAGYGPFGPLNLVTQRPRPSRAPAALQWDMVEPGDDRLRLRWNGTDEATGYVVALAPAFDWGTMQNLSGRGDPAALPTNETHMALTNLDAMTSYTVRVAATSPGGVGPFSPPLVVGGPSPARPRLNASDFYVTLQRENSSGGARPALPLEMREADQALWEVYAPGEGVPLVTRRMTWPALPPARLEAHLLTRALSESFPFFFLVAQAASSTGRAVSAVRLQATMTVAANESSVISVPVCTTDALGMCAARVEVPRGLVAAGGASGLSVAVSTLEPGPTAPAGVLTVLAEPPEAPASAAATLSLSRPPVLGEVTPVVARLCLRSGDGVAERAAAFAVTVVHPPRAQVVTSATAASSWLLSTQAGETRTRITGVRLDLAGGSGGNDDACTFFDLGFEHAASGKLSVQLSELTSVSGVSLLPAASNGVLDLCVAGTPGAPVNTLTLDTVDGGDGLARPLLVSPLQGATLVDMSVLGHPAARLDIVAFVPQVNNGQVSLVPATNVTCTAASAAEALRLLTHVSGGCSVETTGLASGASLPVVLHAAGSANVTVAVAARTLAPESLRVEASPSTLHPLALKTTAACASADVAFQPARLWARGRFYATAAQGLEPEEDITPLASFAVAADAGARGVVRAGALAVNSSGMYTVTLVSAALRGAVAPAATVEADDSRELPLTSSHVGLVKALEVRVAETVHVALDISYTELASEGAASPLVLVQFNAQGSSSLFSSALTPADWRGAALPATESTGVTVLKPLFGGAAARGLLERNLGGCLSSQGRGSFSVNGSTAAASHLTARAYAGVDGATQLDMDAGSVALSLDAASSVGLHTTARLVFAVGESTVSAALPDLTVAVAPASRFSATVNEAGDVLVAALPSGTPGAGTLHAHLNLRDAAGETLRNLSLSFALEAYLPAALDLSLSVVDVEGYIPPAEAAQPTLRPIAHTSTWQAGRLRLTARTALGAALAVPIDVEELVVDGPLLVSPLSEAATLLHVAADAVGEGGNFTLAWTRGSVRAVLSVAVSTQAAEISAVGDMRVGGLTAGSRLVAAVPGGSVGRVDVGVTFDDGSYLPSLWTASGLPVVPGVLGFSSSDPESLAIDPSSGSAAVHGASSRVDITVESHTQQPLTVASFACDFVSPAQGVEGEPYVSLTHAGASHLFVVTGGNAQDPILDVRLVGAAETDVTLLGMSGFVADVTCGGDAIIDLFSASSSWARVYAVRQDNTTLRLHALPLASPARTSDGSLPLLQLSLPLPLALQLARCRVNVGSGAVADLGARDEIVIMRDDAGLQAGAVGVPASAPLVPCAGDDTANCTRSVPAVQRVLAQWTRQDAQRRRREDSVAVVGRDVLALLWSVFYGQAWADAAGFVTPADVASRCELRADGAATALYGLEAYYVMAGPVAVLEAFKASNAPTWDTGAVLIAGTRGWLAGVLMTVMGEQPSRSGLVVPDAAIGTNVTLLVLQRGELSTGRALWWLPVGATADSDSAVLPPNLALTGCGGSCSVFAGEVWPNPVPAPRVALALSSPACFSQRRAAITQVSAVTKGSMLVRWTAPSAASGAWPLTSYTVFARPNGTDPYAVEAVPQSLEVGLTTTVIVGGLQPYAQYIFTVCSESSGTPGPCSEAQVARTLADRPRRAPFAVEVGPGDELGSLALRWSLPRAADIRVSCGWGRGMEQGRALKMPWRPGG